MIHHCCEIHYSHVIVDRSLKIFIESFPSFFILWFFISSYSPQKILHSSKSNFRLNLSQTTTPKFLRSSIEKTPNTWASCHPTDSDWPVNPNRLAELSEEINMLSTQNESLRDSLGEVQDHLASFEDKFTDFLEQAQSLTPRGQLNVSRNAIFIGWRCPSLTIS